MANFGVTEAMVEAEVFGLEVGTSTQPSTAALAVKIGQLDSMASAVFRAKGVDAASLSSTGEGYLYGQLWVSTEAARWASRSSGNAAVEYDRLTSEARDYRERLEATAAVLGEDRATASGSPDLIQSSSQLSDAIDTEVLNNGGLRARMARNREL